MVPPSPEWILLKIDGVLTLYWTRRLSNFISSRARRANAAIAFNPGLRDQRPTADLSLLNADFIRRIDRLSIPVAYYIHLVAPARSTSPVESIGCLLSPLPPSLPFCPVRPSTLVVRKRKSFPNPDFPRAFHDSSILPPLLLQTERKREEERGGGRRWLWQWQAKKTSLSPNVTSALHCRPPRRLCISVPSLFTLRARGRGALK